MPRFPTRSIRSKLKASNIALLLFSGLLIYSSGVLEYALVTSFDPDTFIYPLDIPHFDSFIKHTRNAPSNTTSKSIDQESILPINSYDFRFIVENKEKCQDLKDEKKCRRLKNGQMSASCHKKLSLALMIKSALPNIQNRDVIRQTWGYEDRLIDVNIKRLFIIGSCSPESSGLDYLESQSSLLCQDAIDRESDTYKDIIQGDFIDNYYNNTVKTMMAFKWLNTYCDKIDYVLFVDDDYFVSPKNLIKLLRQFSEAISSPSNNRIYDDFDEMTSEDNPAHLVSSLDDRVETRIYAGYVFNSSIPQRDRFRKWYASLSQYPYSRYPPYVTAGAYVVSRDAMKEIYIASRYVAHFAYDDVYLGLIALKIKLFPLHVNQFYFYKKPYIRAGDYKDVIASHGFSDADELREIWTIEKSWSHV